MLRPGNAGANTAADHITVTDRALAQIPTRTATAPRSWRCPSRRGPQRLRPTAVSRIGADVAELTGYLPDLAGPVRACRLRQINHGDVALTTAGAARRQGTGDLRGTCPLGRRVACQWAHEKGLVCGCRDHARTPMPNPSLLPLDI